jgi:hypothetical protein
MKKIFCCFVIAILSLFLTSAHAANENPLILVKWADLGGDVPIPGYTEYSFATDISMGISNDCSPIPPIDPDCPKFFDGLWITKYATPLGVILAKRCAEYNLFDEITIVSLISGKDPIPQWKIVLKDALVVKISSAIDSTTGRLMEAIELEPRVIEWHFYTYNDRGVQTDHNCAKWDRGIGDVSDCGGT